AQALAADIDPLAFGQQLAEVAVVDRPIAFSQLDDPRPSVGIDPARRGATSVAVDKPGRALLPVRRPEAPELPLRDAEGGARPGRPQITADEPCYTPTPA